MHCTSVQSPVYQGCWEEHPLTWVGVNEGGRVDRSLGNLFTFAPELPLSASLTQPLP